MDRSHKKPDLILSSDSHLWKRAFQALAELVVEVWFRPG